MVYRRAYQAMCTAKWLYLRPDLGRITTDRLVAGAVLVEGRVGDALGLGLGEFAALCIATISRRLTGRAAVERDVAIQHGQEAFAVGRVARLDHQVEDKAAAAAGQVELVAVARLVTALEDDVGVRLE